MHQKLSPRLFILIAFVSTMVAGVGCTRGSSRSVVQGKVIYKDKDKEIPVPYGRVEFYQNGEIVGKSIIDKQGKYVIGNLPQGETQVVVVTKEYIKLPEFKIPTHVKDMPEDFKPGPDGKPPPGVKPPDAFMPKDGKAPKAPLPGGGPPPELPKPPPPPHGWIDMQVVPQADKDKFVPLNEKYGRTEDSASIKSPITFTIQPGTQEYEIKLD